LATLAASVSGIVIGGRFLPSDHRNEKLNPDYGCDTDRDSDMF
jgi:hypothetical protein